jgi:hypothetical protein
MDTLTTGHDGGLYIETCTDSMPANPGSQYVLETCVRGDAAYRLVGKDTVFANCTVPAEGQYVKEVCVLGNSTLPGSDTVLLSCTEPEVGSFVSTPCVSGSPTTLGSDTTTLFCSSPSEGEYTAAACKPGSSALQGADTTLRLCREDVNPGFYVSTVCKSGSALEVGSNPVTSNCTNPLPGYYISAVCIPGSKLSLGTDSQSARCTTVKNVDTQTVDSNYPCSPGNFQLVGHDARIKSKCPVGFLLNSTDINFGCVACPHHRSTVAEGGESCDVCLPGFYIKREQKGIVCTPCPAGGVCSGLGEYPSAAPGYIATGAIDVFVKCVPASSCLSSQGSGFTSDYLHRPKNSDSASVSLYCAEGYTGDFCNECFNDGFTFPRFYRSATSGSQCLKCPETNMALSVFLYLIVAVVILGAAFVIYVRFKLSKQVVIMAITYLQLLATVSSVHLRWTPQTQAALQLTIPFNFNLEVRMIIGASAQRILSSITTTSFPLLFSPLLYRPLESTHTHWKENKADETKTYTIQLHHCLCIGA